MCSMSVNELTLAQVVTTGWRQYYELTKPKVVGLIIFTALVGMLLSTPGPVPLDKMVFGLIGIALAAASGAAFNHILDQRIDAVMERTWNRPFPRGLMDNPRAILFAVGLASMSTLILVSLVNPLTALLTFGALIGYSVLYTVFLKRSTPQNIVWGGLAGAAPPLLGWTAVTGEIHRDALLLMLIIFVWTPPHFWSLAIERREEYANAGLPMLPVTHGIYFTKFQILIYTFMLFSVSLLPFATKMSGMIYLVGAVSLGLGFVYHARLLFCSQEDKYAIRTFRYSIIYLSLLFSFLLCDHYLEIFL